MVKAKFSLNSYNWHLMLFNCFFFLAKPHKSRFMEEVSSSFLCLRWTRPCLMGFPIFNPKLAVLRKCVCYLIHSILSGASFFQNNRTIRYPYRIYLKQLVFFIRDHFPLVSIILLLQLLLLLLLLLLVLLFILWLQYACNWVIIRVRLETKNSGENLLPIFVSGNTFL